MNENIAVKFENVSKQYYLSSQKRPTSLKKVVAKRFDYFLNRQKFFALQGISLEIERGKTLGIIGNNGAGKSTLLRLISGLTKPTKGRVLVRGHLGTLLELGAGFNTEFTGRENVITGSLLAGFTRKEAVSQLDKVIAFSELEDFIDVPVRTYSSGMFMRLAFSTQITLNPDVLLVDEVLAVGDMAFQSKCLAHLRTMKENGKTLILVSHAMDQIRTVCDEVIWLDQGQIRAQGPTKEIIDLYNNRIFENTKQFVNAAKEGEAFTPLIKDNSNARVAVATAPTAPKISQRTGTLEAEIESVALLNDLGQPIKALFSGEPLVVLVNYLANVPIEEPILMVTVRNATGTIVYEIGSNEDNIPTGTIEGKSSFSLTFSALPIMTGHYTISVGIHERNWDRIYCYCHNVAEFVVEGNTPGKGTVLLPHRWEK